MKLQQDLHALRMHSMANLIRFRSFLAHEIVEICFQIPRKLLQEMYEWFQRQLFVYSPRWSCGWIWNNIR